MNGHCSGLLRDVPYTPLTDGVARTVVPFPAGACYRQDRIGNSPCTRAQSVLFARGAFNNTLTFNEERINEMAAV